MHSLITQAGIYSRDCCPGVKRAVRLGRDQSFVEITLNHPLVFGCTIHKDKVRRSQSGAVCLCPSQYSLSYLGRLVADRTLYNKD